MSTAAMLLENNPGSPLAKANGCTCPVIDNGRGAGAYIDPDRGPQFWIADDCPVHGVSVSRPTEPTNG